MSPHQPTILCLACYFKGGRFISACKREGARTILLTTDKLADEDWPFEAIDEFITLPSVSRQPDITNTIAYLYRTRNIKRVVALDEYDTLTAAQVREHLCLAGTHVTQARKLRDKLTMRKTAREAGIAVPGFVGILNYDEVRAFLETSNPPWVLKPRAEASAMGIRRISTPDGLWETLDTLGDRQSHFLLEEFVQGSVHHIDSVVVGGEVIFSAANMYRQPPLDVYAGGGVFCTKTMPYDERDTRKLVAHNEKLVEAFGTDTCVLHGEFIRQEKDAKFVFLEAAARVGGAGIDQLVEHATNINMWEEWARLEVAQAFDRAYELPTTRRHYAGLIVCLSKVQYPNLDTYDDPHVVFTMNKEYHAGLIVASERQEEVDQLVDEYSRRFAEEFLATQPPLESAPDPEI